MEKSRSCLQRFFPITPKWLEVCGILTPSCLKSNHSKRLSQERSLIIQWQNHSLPLLIYILLFGSIIGSNAVKQCCQLWYIIRDLMNSNDSILKKRETFGLELVTLEKMLLQETWPSNNVIWDNFSSERFFSACAFKIRHLQSQNLHKLMTYEETFQNRLMKTSFFWLPTTVCLVCWEPLNQ